MGKDKCEGSREKELSNAEERGVVAELTAAVTDGSILKLIFGGILCKVGVMRGEWGVARAS